MELTDSQVRHWLGSIYDPMALGGDPEFRKLMKAHGWMALGSDQTVASDARTFLKEMIDRALLPRPEAPDHIWQPYRALVLTYLEQHSHFTVARLMSVSSRTLSRAKLRGIKALRACLENACRRH